MNDAVRREEKAVSLTPYLVLGLLVLVPALLVRAPASLLQKAVPPVAGVQAWGGTVWNGQTRLQQDGDSSFVTWHLHPLRLLAGRLAGDVRAEGGLRLSGTVEFGQRSWEIRGMQGEVPATLLQPLLPSGWQFPGVVQAQALLLARDGGMKGPWTAAGGQLHWAGGEMHYSVNGQQQVATLPPLVVNLRLDGDTLMLSLNEEAGNLGLATLRLAPDGMAETQLRERLLRYSPGYRSTGSNPDAVVVTARQPL